MADEVAVVIPTKNRAVQTSQAVISVLEQSHQVQEIVIVDDGSEKKEIERLEALLPRDKRINLKLLAMPTFHPGIARKIGIKNTNSEWIAFLDSDDIWLPNKIEAQIDLAREKKSRAISCNAFRRETSALKQTKFFNSLPSEVSLKKLMKRNYIITSTVLVKRDLLEQISLFATSYSARSAEDYATWLRCSTIENWQCLDKEMIIYNDDLQDGIRGDGEIIQNFSDVIGIVDFANWSRTQKHRQSAIKTLERKFGFHLFKKGIIP